jgi:hypothetical protein
MLYIGNLEFKTFEFSLNLWIWEKEIENKMKRRKGQTCASWAEWRSRPTPPSCRFLAGRSRVPLPCGARKSATSTGVRARLSMSRTHGARAVGRSLRRAHHSPRLLSLSPRNAYVWAIFVRTLQPPCAEPVARTLRD